MGQFTFEEINLICCYRRKTRADTVAAMTAALPYMETEIQELAELTAEKLKKLTEEKFAELVFLPAEGLTQNLYILFAFSLNLTFLKTIDKQKKFPYNFN